MRRLQRELDWVVKHKWNQNAASVLPATRKLLPVSLKKPQNSWFRVTTFMTTAYAVIDRKSSLKYIILLYVGRIIGRAGEQEYL